MATNRRKRVLLPFNRVQRLLLFGAATLWLAALVLSKQRNYQDSWILEDILWPFVGFVAIFLVVWALESDNRIVALLCAWAVAVVALIPALKYRQPYGTTIDATAHYLMTERLLTSGRVGLAAGGSGRVVGPEHVYSAIPGMHAWLASLGLTGGFSATAAIKFGLPLTAAIAPLMVYWLCRRMKMDPSLAKYTIGASCLVIYPSFIPNGTSFSKIPLFMVLGAVVLREYYSTSQRERLGYTLVALIGLAQLVIWHSTTPMVAPLILGSLSLAPVVVWLVRRSAGRLSLTSGIVRLALLAAILFVAYHLVETDKVFYVLASRLWHFVAAEKPAPSPIPRRAFEITLLDVLRVMLVMHGRDAAVFGLMALGLLVIWRHRTHWEHLLPFYASLLLICAPFGVLLLTGIVGSDYGRLIIVPVFLATFFAAPTLWWLFRKLPTAIPRARWLARPVQLLTLVVLLGVWIVQFFTCQPLIPRARTLTPDTSGEYVVWLHMVNNAYQQRMLNFVRSHTSPDTRLAVDYWTASQFTRYFGSEAAYRQGLYQPLHWQRPIDPTKVKLFLLHWPGPAGGLAEQVEYRSVAKIAELRDTPGWGLIYDNGESFVLQIR